MTQYLLSMYQPGGTPPPREILEPVMRKVNAIIQDLKAQQLWVNGGLHPIESATVVRKEHGKLVTTDGPYAEGKEHVGGVMVIKAPDLDAALRWAGRLADAVILEGHDRGLSVEVRPFQQNQ